MTELTNERIEELEAKAREAVTKLRDFSRDNGMNHFVRDPLVMDIHRALDLLTELTALRATVAKLPRTADGVAIVPGMEVHHSFYGCVLNVVSVYQDEATVCGDKRYVVQGSDMLPCNELFSTRELALAALANSTGGGK